MAKLKKYERVNNYLSQKWDSGEWTSDSLANLHYKELVDVPEFKDIGDRTIANILKDFKKSQGVLPVTVNVSKKKIVRDYLDSLMTSGELNPDTISEINYHDLVGKTDLEGIGKTTISSVLSEYKKRYENSLVDEGILSFIGKQSESNSPSREVSVKLNGSNPFDQNEIVILKKLIEVFNQNPDLNVPSVNFELRELKSALDFVGINPQTILDRYRKTRNVMVTPITRMMSNVQSREDFSYESA